MSNKEEASEHLRKAALLADPFAQFAAWYLVAEKLERSYPNAMALATSDQNNRPAVRMVLFRKLDERGFGFFTNYNSRKAMELADNPFAALAFYWHECGWQVRVEGFVKKMSAKESDAYFDNRPTGSQISAWASNQSQVISNRKDLDKASREVGSKFKNQQIPRPAHWGGFWLLPKTMEFWQAHIDRLHDRFRYNKLENDSWTIKRLAP